jgi:hypothetical protein
MKSMGRPWGGGGGGGGRLCGGGQRRRPCRRRPLPRLVRRRGRGVGGHGQPLPVGRRRVGGAVVGRRDRLPHRGRRRRVADGLWRWGGWRCVWGCGLGRGRVPGHPAGRLRGRAAAAAGGVRERRRRLSPRPSCSVPVAPPPCSFPRPLAPSLRTTPQVHRHRGSDRPPSFFFSFSERTPLLLASRGASASSPRGLSRAPSPPFFVR